MRLRSGSTPTGYRIVQERVFFGCHKFFEMIIWIWGRTSNRCPRDVVCDAASCACWTAMQLPPWKGWLQLAATIEMLSIECKRRIPTNTRTLLSSLYNKNKFVNLTHRRNDATGIAVFWVVGHGPNYEHVISTHPTGKKIRGLRSEPFSKERTLVQPEIGR